MRERCLDRARSIRASLLRSRRYGEKEPSPITEGSREYIALQQELGRIITEEVQASRVETNTSIDEQLWEWTDASASSQLESSSSRHLLDSHVDKDDYDAIMSHMLQHVMQEQLQAEEAELLEEFEAMNQWEEAQVHSMVDSAYADQTGPVGEGAQPLLCPVCRRCHVLQNRHVLYCGCGGLRLEVQHEGLGLQDMRDALASACVKHAQSGCTMDPIFQQDTHLGVSILFLKCTGCHALDAVI